jgi:hypothetical protein
VSVWKKLLIGNEYSVLIVVQEGYKYWKSDVLDVHVPCSLLWNAAQIHVAHVVKLRWSAYCPVSEIAT